MHSQALTALSRCLILVKQDCTNCSDVISSDLIAFRASVAVKALGFSGIILYLSDLYNNNELSHSIL